MLASVEGEKNNNKLNPHDTGSHVGTQTTIVVDVCSHHGTIPALQLLEERTGAI